MLINETFPGTSLNTTVWSTAIKDSTISVASNKCTITGSGWYGGAIRTKDTASLLNTVTVEFDYAYTGSLHQNGAGAYEYVAFTGSGTLTRDTSYYYGLTNKALALYLDTTSIYLKCLDTGATIATYSITATSIHIKMVYTPATNNISVYVNNSATPNMSATVPTAELTALGTSVNLEFYYGNYQAGTVNSGIYSNIKISDIINAQIDLNSFGTVRPSIGLDSSATLRLTKTTDLNMQGTISPYIGNDLESHIEVYTKLMLSSNATVRNKLELVSNALIQFVNTLDINYVISCMEDLSDLNSIGVASWTTDFLSDAMIRVWGTTDLDSIVHSAKYTDLVSSGYKPYTSDLDSKTLITDLNTMDIVFKLIQAPILILNCSSLQDTYIRESRPTLNYGSAQSLLVGHPLEGQYESLLQLDTHAYNNINVNNAISVISANLILKIIGTYDSSMIIDVYECTTYWNETSVTWSSFSQPAMNLITSFTCTDSTVKVDLTSYINQRQLNGFNYVNLILKARDPNNGQIISFESLNSPDTSSRPHIEVKYQDNAWDGYVASTDLNGSATIRTTNAKDLMSNVTKRATAYSFLDSIVIVERTATTNITSTTTVRHTDVTDLPSQAYGLPCTDMESTVTIRHTDLKDINSSTNIYIKEDLDSIVDIKSFNAWLNGQAMIRGYSTSDLDSTVVIRHNTDLDSNAIARLNKFMELSSKAIIRDTNNIDLTSLATIRQYIDLLSNAIIERSVNLDLPSTGASRWTDQTDLPSTITVRGSYNDLTSTATKRTNGYNDIYSYSYSAFGDSLDSTVTVQSLVHSDNADLNSSVTVRKSNLTDLDSTAKLYNTINLVSSAIVRKIATTDLPSTITVRQIADLVSTATLKQIKDLVSTVKVRHTDLTDMLSLAIIRQFDITELDSVAYLYGMEICDVRGDVMVQRKGNGDLDSKAEIYTTARQWIPNIHGIDKFNYEDRKLPRQWIREKFI